MSNAGVYRWPWYFSSQWNITREGALRVGAYTSHNGYREGIVIWYVERDTYRAGWYTYVY